MPSSKLLILGLLGVGALGVTLSDGVKMPWVEPRQEAYGKAAQQLGYLTPASLPNSAVLLPPPPADGSAALKRDLTTREAALALRGTTRYALATSDANRGQDQTIQAFECAAGIDISQERTPQLYRLLTRTRVDVRASSYFAKTRYKRARPFVVHSAKPCYASDEELVQGDGSYPSARGAVGWAYALVLAELFPDRADVILARGSQFGVSRVVCDEEWLSDVEAGRQVATVTIGRLRELGEFKKDMDAARAEAAAAVASGSKPSADCSLEISARRQMQIAQSRGSAAK